MSIIEDLNEPFLPPVEEKSPLDKVKEALNTLNTFLQKYQVDDDWINERIYFSEMERPPIVREFMSDKMKAFNDSLESWLLLAADNALDIAMRFLLKTQREKKEKRDTQLVNEVASACYKVFSIFGSENYSPKRLFQFALSHYLAMKKKHCARNSSKVPDKLKYGHVKWNIVEFLHPKAMAGGKIDTQITMMKKALQQATMCGDKKLANSILFVIQEIEKFEKIENLSQWEERFLIMMESFMKNMQLGKISHKKHELLIDSGHPDYPPSITEPEQIKAALLDAISKIQLELEPFRGIQILPEIAVLSDSIKKITFYPNIK